MKTARESLADALAWISITYTPESKEHRVLNEAITMLLHPEDFDDVKKEPARN